MKSKVLFIVEGKNTEIKILKNKNHGLLQFLNFDYEIVSFCNPIYELFEDYKRGKYHDLVTYLCKEKGLKVESKGLLKNAFAAVYLIFDFEPHYHKYSDAEIIELLDTFNDETRLGKLYINYPMVEAFYHLVSRTDNDYLTRFISLDNFNGSGYKKLVNKESCFIKSALTRKDICYIIMNNYNKVKYMGSVDKKFIDYKKILDKELAYKREKNSLSVLSTMPLLLIDYNPDMVLEAIKGEIAS